MAGFPSPHSVGISPSRVTFLSQPTAHTLELGITFGDPEYGFLKALISSAKVLKLRGQNAQTRQTRWHIQAVFETRTDPNKRGPHCTTLSRPLF